MWNLENNNNKSKLIDTENRFVVARGRVGGGGKNGQKGVKKYRLPVTK